MPKNTNINSLFSNSPYLSRLADMGFEVKSIDANFLEAIVIRVDDYAKNNDHSFSKEECQQFLVKIKAEFAFYWSLSQLNESVPFAELGRLQSIFADATINFAA